MCWWKLWSNTNFLGRSLPKTCYVEVWAYIQYIHSFVVYPVQTGSAALHVAAQEDHLRVVEILLEANADVNIKTNVRIAIHKHDT